MAYRIFTDSQGAAWQAWDVVPRLEERRVTDRRTRATQPPHSDRRSHSDRRILPGHRSVLNSGLTSGWLCFETADEKRRLSPIPDDWLRCPDAELEHYCAAATPARRVTQELRQFDLRE
ncbi:MAG: hypothetical protein ABJA80_10590 [bacterium]